ncbi:unnamed protein product [Vicia faba]|uniref:Cullin N-terminal domain-containing protein n=1 Tax=Vicia faba TaxID=3906 RepID=A0AAV0ZNH6_VICFA|nr:unnamed protein product [Vicia faba]
MTDRKTIDLDQGWAYMQNGIKNLKTILEGSSKTQFSSKEYMMLYTTIYNMCTQKPPLDYSQDLYDKYKGFFEEYIRSTVLSSVINKHDNSYEIMNQLKSSRIHKSIRGEILCLWKLLDSHFRLNSSKYVEHDSMFGVSVESMITKNQFSVETLFYCWICWKDNIVQMLDFLSNFKTLEPQVAKQLREVCIELFGCSEADL